MKNRSKNKSVVSSVFLFSVYLCQGCTTKYPYGIFKGKHYIINLKSDNVPVILANNIITPHLCMCGNSLLKCRQAEDTNILLTI